MRPLNAIFTAALTITGCQQNDCLDADCAADPGDRPITLDPGFDEAKRELESDGVVLPDDSDVRVTDEIEPDLRERCEIIAYMAARWHADGNSYDGLILNRSGRTLADIDGRFAGVRGNHGVFAGGYTVSWGTIVEPIETDPVRPDDDDERTADADGDEMRDEWKPTEPTEPTEPTDPLARIKGTMGGHYTGTPQTFAGTISRGTDQLPIRGMWKATDRDGGYALGAVLNCSDSTEVRRTEVEVKPEPIRED